MITFQNINTQHIFILPDKKAIEIINQAPDMYKIISGLEKELLIINPEAQIPQPDLSNDIYNLVVVEDSADDKNIKIIKKTVKRTSTKRKTVKRKVTKSKKKEK